jgi:hypothetical protein
MVPFLRGFLFRQSLLGKGGNIISEMRRQTRENIRIFGKDGLPKCASENEELVQITGEPSVARDALIQITTRLRQDIFKDKDGASNTGTVRFLFHQAMAQGNMV